MGLICQKTYQSCRQIFMMSFIGINSFANGLLYGSNIFNFYTPSHYCGYDTGSVSQLRNDTVYYCEEKQPNSDLIGNYSCTYFNHKLCVITVFNLNISS